MLKLVYWAHVVTTGVRTQWEVDVRREGRMAVVQIEGLSCGGALTWATESHDGESLWNPNFLEKTWLRIVTSMLQRYLIDQRELELHFSF